MTALRLRCLAAMAAFLASTQLAWPAPPKPSGLNYSCGGWEPSKTRPGFKCRICSRCSTKKVEGEETLDCGTIVHKTQCTDGDTDGIDPPADRTGGTRPGSVTRPPVAPAAPRDRNVH